MMIKLTRLNHKEFFLNPHLIKIVEKTPDTIIRLVNDEHYLVLETVEEVIAAVIAYRVELRRRASEPHLLGEQLGGAENVPCR